ncbi:hypothetical protein BU14_0254s0016 [Porphyra umbilicalis]|uniref:Uncharacterized protein n=1 Tax=Porphyra umbilicalis TaxID=2786 RepID=A0A1X6P2Y9_PORUM|nr:hypothetical protein BU14_0254s0016 [Porphyra umbilicalis]|eukprot:OSX75136.1 hypothetical protein BU14_0254s0016 [Porphyra umbilicalis]
MAFVASSPALLRAARAPATSTRRPVAAARVVMAADPQKAPSSEGPVTSGVPPARKYPGVENDMAQLEEQAADHVEDPAGLTNKAPKDE